jgi:diguanylate cyclase (GGDEF)-like protein
MPTNTVYWYQVPAVIATGIALFVAYQAWTRRSVRGATPTMLLMLAAAVWAATSVREVGAHDLATKLFWVKMEYPGIAFVALCWYALTREYTGVMPRLSAGAAWLLSIIPLLTILCTWTNQYHGLMYMGTSLATEHGITVLIVKGGTWYWVHVVYSYLLILLGLGMAVQAWAQAVDPFRQQMEMLVLAALLPIAVSVAYVSHALPMPHLDMTPLAFVASGTLIIWGTLRHQLWELVPIARNAIFELMTDIVIVLDGLGRVVDINPAALEALECRVAITLGQPFAVIATDWPALVALTNESHVVRRTLARPGEPSRVFDFSVSPLAGTGGHLIVGRDVTERQEMEERLVYLAYHDMLTGLPNRSLFMDRLRNALARGQRTGQHTALVFLDLDQFKDVNDTLGHMEGDAVLREVATRLANAVRASDTVARFGGDEFAFVFSDLHDRESVAPLIQRIFEQFTAPFPVGERAWPLTPSVGVTVAPDDDEGLEELLRNADVALYAAKEAGRNGVRYHAHVVV